MSNNTLKILFPLALLSITSLFLEKNITSNVPQGVNLLSVSIFEKFDKLTT